MVSVGKERDGDAEKELAVGRSCLRATLSLSSHLLRVVQRLKLAPQVLLVCERHGVCVSARWRRVGGRSALPAAATCGGGGVGSAFSGPPLPPSLPSHTKLTSGLSSLPSFSSLNRPKPAAVSKRTSMTAWSEGGEAAGCAEVCSGCSCGGHAARLVPWFKHALHAGAERVGRSVCVPRVGARGRKKGECA